MKLTKTEWEIIEHRLCLDDCLADCLEEEFPRNEVEAAANSLWRNFKEQFAKSGFVEWDEKTATKAEIAVLKDCLDGSTFFGGGGAEDAVASGELKRGTLLNWMKAANSLEEKFRLAGIVVNIPRN